MYTFEIGEIVAEVTNPRSWWVVKYYSEILTGVEYVCTNDMNHTRYFTEDELIPVGIN